MTEMSGELLGPCPFCGKDLAYGEGADGRPDSLIHEMPMCPKFESMDPLDFIRAARNLMQARNNIS